MDLSMEKKQSKENFAEKMHFRVVSRHPSYSPEMAVQIKQEMLRELGEIFKNDR